MKKWWLLCLVLIILAISVNAKCGDYFCDSTEDCESCPDDCLCTKDSHDEDVECCNDFSCQECASGYCKDRICKNAAGLVSIFQEIECFVNGSINMEIKFRELDSIDLVPNKDLKVYMKKKDDAKSFSEINGTWFNPTKDGTFKYTKIADISSFSSDKDLFNLPETYSIRIKYKMGRSDNIFEDTEVICPGMPIEPVIAPVVKEPEVEPVEPPRKEVEEIVEELSEVKEEPIVEEIKEETIKESNSEEIVDIKEKTNPIWYVLIGVILVIAVIFFFKYEIRILKKRE